MTERILTADELWERHRIVVAMDDDAWVIRKHDTYSCKDWDGHAWSDYNAERYITEQWGRAAASKIVAEQAEPVIEVWWREPDDTLATTKPRLGNEVPQPVIIHPDGRVEVKEVVPDEALTALSSMLPADPTTHSGIEQRIAAWLRTARAVATKVKEAT